MARAERFLVECHKLKARVAVKQDACLHPAEVAEDLARWAECQAKAKGLVERATSARRRRAELAERLTSQLQSQAAGL